MIKKIALGLLLVVVALVALVAVQPAEFRIERSATVATPPEVPFALVNDFHRWEAWSPWVKLDPDLKIEFGGPPSGVGSTYAWTGNQQVGTGRMTITDSQANERVGLRLEFEKPFQATNAATFTFRPVPAGTAVTWTMTGRNGFAGKAVGLVMNVDELVGQSFDEGLASITKIAEAESKAVAGAR
jgi:hypothetical protein